MALVIAFLLLLVFAPSAAAQDDIQAAAEALRRDPVYVAPGAELAGQVDVDALRDRIRSSGASPMYVAVLSGDAAASPDEALTALHDAVGLRGTYAVVAGRSFRAGSDLFRVAGEASAAAQSHDNVEGALEDFIGRVGDLRAGRQPSGSGGGGGSGSFGIVLFVLLRSVFLPVKGEENTFAVRLVSTGTSAGGLVSIISGLEEGERIVTAGTFILKADLLKSTAKDED